jgi:hypothetical protein
VERRAGNNFLFGFRVNEVPNKTLKVPKCEIFDGSDFHDFYTIKSVWEGDFGVKIKDRFFNI